jgi:outer membrane protein assembly factor BamB
VTCVDVETGERRWKGGRYGNGQLLLLVDQDLLLIVSEKGDLVLVEASPERHRQLARISAVQGKTWNHPVVAHGKLIVRNGEEVVCFALPSA